jgi:hypothetical protein
MRVLHDGATAGRLGFVRAGVFGTAIVTVARDSIIEIARLPPEFFMPAGVLALLPANVFLAMTQEAFLRPFEIGLLVVLFLGMIGAPPYRAVAALGALGFTIQQTLGRSVGFMNHGDIGLLFALWVLTLFPAADGFAIPKRRTEDESAPVYANALVTLTIALLLGYVAIGAHRIAYASPDVFFGDTMRFHITARLIPENMPFEALRHFVVTSPLLVAASNGVFLFVTLLEITSFFVLISQRFRLFWASAMIPFHVSTLLLMNIFFWQNLLLIVLLLAEPQLLYAARRPTTRGNGNE